MFINKDLTITLHIGCVMHAYIKYICTYFLMNFDQTIDTIVNYTAITSERPSYSVLFCSFTGSWSDNKYIHGIVL